MSGSAPSRWRRFASLLVGLAAALLYLQTVGYGLVNYDDPWLLQNNTLLQKPSWEVLWKICFDLSWPVRYRLGAEYLPLRDLSIMLDFALYGRWFGGFHLTNVLLYGAICSLVVEVLYRWSGALGASVLAGLLFAFHPVHVEAVAWLSSRKDLLSSFWLLLAAVFFHRFASQPTFLRWLVCALLLILAIWSKATAISGIAFLALLLWFFPPEETSPSKDSPNDDTPERWRLPCWMAQPGRSSKDSPDDVASESPQDVSGADTPESPPEVPGDVASVSRHLPGHDPSESQERLRSSPGEEQPPSASPKEGRFSQDVSGVDAPESPPHLPGHDPSEIPQNHLLSSWTRYLPWALKRLWRRPSWRWVGGGFFGLALLVFLAMLPLWLTAQKAGIVREYHGGSFWRNLLLMFQVYGYYARLLLPVGEWAIRYPLTAATLSPLWLALGLSLTLLTLAVALVGSWRLGRWTPWAFAAACWWIFFLPVSHLFVPVANLLADRYLFLPSLALSVALGFWLGRPHSSRWHLLFLGLLLLLFLSHTLRQIPTWSSTEALYRQALRVDPQNPNAMIQLARVQEKKGRYTQAWRLLQQGLRLHPGHSRLLLHQGIFLYRRGRLSAARKKFRKAARDPQADKARANLALLLLRTRQIDEAFRWARQAVQIRPRAPHNQRVLGTVALEKGLFSVAETAFRQTLHLEPEKPRNYYNMAVLFLRQGKRRQALRWLRQTLRRHPHYPDAQRLLQRLSPGTR